MTSERSRRSTSSTASPSLSSRWLCSQGSRILAFKARIRDPCEHNQREDSEGDAVEEVERLERSEVIGGSDDEARNRGAAAETEVACDSAERDRGGALLR